jgi:hypothetical protein
MSLFLERDLYGGKQKIFKFNNGYGASVVRHMGSYGSEQGLWELAVIRFLSKGEWDLCYSTPITNDVIGYLTWEEIEELLKKIEGLK